MKHLYPLFMVLGLAACASKAAEDNTLPAPTGLRAELQEGPAALLTWQDNSSNEKGYYVFQDATVASPTATLPAGSTSYRFEGLTPGATYRFGVQAFGEGYALSPMAISGPFTVPEPEPEPEQDPEPDPSEVLRLSWTAVTDTDLPASVQLFETTTPLEGKPFHAWYAVADCSRNSDIEFKVLFPGGGKTATLDAQASAQENCLVLINGGIFGTGNIGFAILDGDQTPWRTVPGDGYTEYVDKQAWGPVPNSAYNRLHPVSRGLFGVNRAGVPGVYWSFTPEYGTVYVYDEPIPTVGGEALKPEGSTTYPCAPASWKPYNAITCGPVLLHDWKCPISAEKTAGGHWKTNYELWADDIFGVDSYADRTAVGYLSDGRVVLFICDGRISASGGATTLQLARIMRGLGCKGALNLDGGGSTGMWVTGKHLNDLTGGNRPLMTTVGFFKR